MRDKEESFFHALFGKMVGACSGGRGTEGSSAGVDDPGKLNPFRKSP